jgi:hypothetical protein
VSEEQVLVDHGEGRTSGRQIESIGDPHCGGGERNLAVKSEDVEESVREIGSGLSNAMGGVPLRVGVNQ